MALHLNMSGDTLSPHGGAYTVDEASRRPIYRLGLALAIFACVFSVWTSIVRDDGTGGTHFMIILAVVVGGFATSFQPRGMARTMLGVAIMQLINGMLIATAPVTASVLGGSVKALVFNGFLMALWLLSAGIFRCASVAGENGGFP